MKYFVEFKTVISAKSEEELMQKIREQLAQRSPLNDDFNPLSIDVIVIPPEED